jgi:hypothetical protein
MADACTSKHYARTTAIVPKLEGTPGLDRSVVDTRALQVEVRRGATQQHLSGSIGIDSDARCVAPTSGRPWSVDMTALAALLAAEGD